ncbi:MAG: 50S ribosomal protein L25 [Victivallales bacterium]|nr:50S ribosomal protein L25 [Victivallales bacterium]
MSINANERSECGTTASRRMRRAGMVPVVMYSHGQEAIALSITAADAAKIHQHTGLLELVDTDNGNKRTAVVKDVQIHPLNNSILHIDLLAVKADEIVESTVEVEGIGEAVGTRAGGQLEQVLFELAIKSKPTDIPEKIVVDVSGIELDQALHVKDVVAPEGVEIITDPELIVFHVRTVKAEEPAEETAAATEGAAEAPAAEEKK